MCRGCRIQPGRFPDGVGRVRASDRPARPWMPTRAGPRTMRLSPRMCPTCVSPQEQLLRRCPLDFVSCSSIFFFWVGRARASDRVRGSFHIPHTQLWAAVSDRGREGLGGARPAHAEPGSMRHRKNTRGWARVPRLVAAAMPICDRRATGGGMSYRIVPEPTSVLCVDRGVGVPDGRH